MLQVTTKYLFHHNVFLKSKAADKSQLVLTYTDKKIMLDSIFYRVICDNAISEWFASNLLAPANVDYCNNKVWSNIILSVKIKKTGSENK